MNKKHKEEYLLRKLRVREFFEGVKKGRTPMIERRYSERSYRDFKPPASTR